MVPQGLLAGQFERHILAVRLLAHDPSRPDATFEGIREAVLAGADVNLADDGGRPPLNLACRFGPRICPRGHSPTSQRKLPTGNF